MFLLRMSRAVVLTLLFVALFSSFAWSDDTQFHSFHVDVVGHGRPMILIRGLSGRPTPIAEPLVAEAREVHSRQAARSPLHRLAQPGRNARDGRGDRSPELVGPLVIVDMLPFLGGTALEAQSCDEQWAAYGKSGASVKYMVTAPADLATLIQRSTSSDRRTVTDALADAYGLDLRDDVSRITTPVLALRTWQVVHDQLPRLHFALAETSRHFIMFDDPTWFCGELDSFLTDPDAVVRTRGISGN